MEQNQLREQINDIVLPYEENREKLVLSVGVIIGDQQKEFTFGQNVDVNANNDYIYEIGSVSKVFTTSLLAKMVEEKKIDLQEPIVKYLPSLTKNKSLQDQNVTILHLATHTSGFPKIPLSFLLKGIFSKKIRSNPYKYYTEKNMINFISKFTFKDVGKKMNYSNLGMGLLGYILCNILETEYEKAIQVHIGQPLGLANTAVNLSDDQQQKLIPGYNTKNEMVSNWDIPVLAGAGALRSTLKDQLTFLSNHIGVDDSEVHNILCKTHHPYHQDEKGLTVGLGWIIDNTKNLIWHNGGTGGYSSFMAFNKEDKIGVVILSNYEPSFSPQDSIDHIGYKVMELLKESL